MAPEAQTPTASAGFPATLGGRVLLTLALAGFGLLVALLVVLGSMWIEARFPSDDTQRALLPAAQRVTTKPVVDALGRQVERTLRRRAEARDLRTGLTIEETIARMLDARVGLGKRAGHAYRLAKDGSPAAVAALRELFRTAPPAHKAFIAQRVGTAANDTARALLLPLLDDADPEVVIAAIRGLGVAGDAVITDRLAAILNDPQRPLPVRVEAAFGLGSIGSLAARDALVATFTGLPEGELARQVLAGLGRLPFPSIAATLESYVAAPGTPAAMRVAAVEALANSSPDAVPFLLGLAAQDADAGVRAAAAWAISAHPGAADGALVLATLAEREAEADVRRRLYEAMLPQSGIASERLLPLVLSEQDLAARVAGFNALGRATREAPASPAAATFDRQIVPELVRIATNPNSLNIQMRAVFALRRAGTPAARAALAVIAANAPPQVATAARNGLQAANS